MTFATTRHLRRFRVFALGVFCSGLLPGTGQAECKLGAVAVLPLSDRGEPFVFSAKVNGHAAGLSVETGSDLTTVDLASAESLGIDMHPTDRVTHGIGGIRKTYYGTVRKMQIGGMNASDLVVRGLQLGSHDRNPDVVGQLGMDLMGAYDLDFDTPGGTLIIYKAEGWCGTPTVALAQPLYATPLVDIYHDRQADIDVIIEGKHFRAMLDSGLAHTSMYRSAAQRLGLDTSGFTAAGHKTVHGFGPLGIAYFDKTFATMQIGDLTFNNTSVRVLDQQDAGLDRYRVGSLLTVSDATGGHEVMLGADFMRKVHLWISHSSHMLIMQYPPQASLLPK